VLKELHIKNFALIDELTLELAESLNILTGETGAGKSIIIGAVGLVLGERASAEHIRTGSDMASVEAIFDLPKNWQKKNKWQEKGIDLSGGELLIRREISRDGKNKCYVNGQVITISLLYQLGQRLVDLLGQHEHQLLLKVENHLEALDSFGELPELKENVNRLYSEVKNLELQKQRLTEAGHELERRIEMLKFQANEISQANLHPGEEEELKTEREILVNAEKIHGILGNTYLRLYGSEDKPSAIDLITGAESDLKEMSQFNPGVESGRQTLERIIAELKDISSQVRDMMEKAVFDPDRLEEIESRISLLQKLKKKYGGTIAEIIQFGEKARQELQGIEHRDEEIEKIEKELKARKPELLEHAEKLSEKRKKQAKRLEEMMEKELSDLSMKAVFRVSFSMPDEGISVEEKNKEIKINQDGIDIVEFLISANVGEPPRPLAKIASGGEISRVMLAMKVILADVDSVPVLIFDEIDSGIGGQVAECVGRKLQLVAGNRQVICITHLPAIAGFAVKHFGVQKNVKTGRSVTVCEPLSQEQRVEELAKMLGGKKVTDISRQHAKELLKK